MTTYAVYRADTGNLVSIGTVLAPTDRLQERGLAAKELTDGIPADSRWDPDLKDFVAVVPDPAPSVTTFADVRAAVAEVGRLLGSLERGV